MNRIDSLREVVFSRLTELTQEIDRLQQENHALRNGLEGSCYACEPVAELNRKLTDAGHALYHAIGYFTNDFEFMNDREYLFTSERAAINKWRELFDNNIPEQNYED